MNPLSLLTDDELHRKLSEELPESNEWHRVSSEIHRRLLSGDATWIALERAVNDLVSSAPQDHDVLVQVRDVSVLKAFFIKPHTFLFEGFDQDGHRTRIIIHFSQVEARVVYLPKRGPDRVVTGFSRT